ncbi:MAG: ACT domain-containing protein [Tepidisphaeraceae bacterium]|jgi:predicted amino acid-binding ACT domain protein
MSQLIITAVGPDRPGIVGELTAHLHAGGANILDSRMVNLRGEFAMLILLEAADAAAGADQASGGRRAGGGLPGSTADLPGIDRQAGSGQAEEAHREQSSLGSVAGPSVEP